MMIYVNNKYIYIYIKYKFSPKEVNEWATGALQIWSYPNPLGVNQARISAASWNCGSHTTLPWPKKGKLETGQRAKVAGPWSWGNGAAEQSLDLAMSGTPCEKQLGAFSHQTWPKWELGNGNAVAIFDNGGAECNHRSIVEWHWCSY